ncbi:MAG: winged helix-turn-helix transcriptional regulator [Solirubrobacterales bacterium]
MTVLDDLKKLEASIVKRYRELQPALAEVEELRRVADRLGVDLDRPSTKTAKPATATRTRTRRTASGRKRAKVTSPRRPRAGGRREQVLNLVTERPGITVPEIGKALKVDPTGLYRYAKQLEADGTITKDGTKLYPAG